MSKKDQQNQARDDVLRRLLRTSPSPKNVGKSAKNVSQTGTPADIPVKSLKDKRESGTVAPPQKAPIPDNADDLVEWGKNRIQDE